MVWLWRNSHLEEVPELGQSEVTRIVQVRRLEEPELKDVIWWCGNYLKAIILCDYVISILFCKYVYHHKYIYIYINIFNMIRSYQKLTMDFVVDLLLIFAWVLQAFHLAPPFWCSCVLWSELLRGVPSRLRTESVQLTGWRGRIWQPKHSTVQQVSSSVIWYHAKKRLSLDKVPLRPGEASWTHCAGAQVSAII